MTQPKDPQFAFECPRTWDSLAPTTDAAVRHCGDCDKPVHLSRTAAEAEAHGRAGRCVALPTARVRRGVGTVIAAWLRAIVRGRAPVPLERIPDPPPPPPPPRGSMKVGMFMREPEPEPRLGWLVCVEGPARGQLLQLGDGAVTIGSGDGATIRIDDDSIARVHCRVGLEAGEFVITDLSNGKTFMNDRAIARGELVDSDRITLGSRKFVFKAIG